MCLQIFIHAFRHFRWPERGRAYDPGFSVDLSRSRAYFRGPEILYIFRRNCYTSQADANSSFPSGVQLISDPQAAGQNKASIHPDYSPVGLWQRLFKTWDIICYQSIHISNIREIARSRGRQYVCTNKICFSIFFNIEFDLFVRFLIYFVNAYRCHHNRKRQTCSRRSTAHSASQTPKKISCNRNKIW